MPATDPSIQVSIVKFLKSLGSLGLISASGFGEKLKFGTVMRKVLHITGICPRFKIWYKFFIRIVNIAMATLKKHRNNTFCTFYVYFSLLNDIFNYLGRYLKIKKCVQK